MSKKTPKEEDLQDWQSFIQDVKILKEDDKRLHFVKRQTTINRDQIHQRRRREYYEGQRQPLITEQVAGQTHKIMRVSKIVIEGRIDLHGLTKDQAQQQVQFFLMNAQIQRKIWVLVITGKGQPEVSVTLRGLVPGWLDALPYVSGYAPAKPADGGDGALYVRLKKLRDF